MDGSIHIHIAYDNLYYSNVLHLEYIKHNFVLTRNILNPNDICDKLQWIIHYIRDVVAI